MSSIGQGSSEVKFCGAEESNIHFAYQCTFYMPVLEWFKSLIYKCCSFNPKMIKVLMLDISNGDRIDKNTCIILVATYITNIWIARKAGLTPLAAIKLSKGKTMYNTNINLYRFKAMYNKNINLYRFKAKFSTIFTESYKSLEYGNM